MMATVIDELVVVLGLDPKKLTDGQKAAVQSTVDTNRQINRSNQESGDADKKRRESETAAEKDRQFQQKKTAEALENTKKQVLSLAATVIGAKSIGDYLSSTVTSVASLGRVAQLMGQSAPDLQAFRLVVQQTGGNADTAANSFLRLSQIQQNWRTGYALPDATYMLGLSKIGSGQSDDPLTIFEKFAAWTKGRKGPEVLQEGSLLGLDIDSINAAQKAGPNAAAMLAAQKANLPSDADIKKVTALQQEFFKLRQDVQGSANSMLYDASPALVGFLKLVDAGVTKFPLLTKAVLALSVALTALGAVKVGAGLLAILGSGGAAAAAAKAGGAVAAGEAVAGGAAGLVAGAPVATVAIGAEALLTKSQGQKDIEAKMNASQNPSTNAVSFADATGAWLTQMFGGKTGAAAAGGTSKAAIAGRVAAAAAITPRGSNASIVEANLRAAGLSGDDLEAAMRGLNAEDPGFDPNRVNPISAGAGDHARGIAQWLRPRAREFAKWAGHDLAHSTISEQAAFVKYELQNSAAGKRALAGMSAANSLHDKTFAFLQNFEAPGPAGMAIDMRNAGFGGRPMRNLSSGGSTTTIDIGAVNINVPSADPKVIAKGIKRSLASTLANQGNTALN